AHDRRQALVGRGISEVAAHVGESRREAIEDVVVHRFAGAFDAFAGVLAQVLDRPIVTGDPDDRAVEKSPQLEPIERTEGHHLREVAGDPEDHQKVGGLGFAGAVSASRGPPVRSYRCAHSLSLLVATSSDGPSCERHSTLPSGIRLARSPSTWAPVGYAASCARPSSRASPDRDERPRRRNRRTAQYAPAIVDVAIVPASPDEGDLEARRLSERSPIPRTGRFTYGVRVL